ncbi:unnamed protein product [Ectocarpus sp. 8 AP-2014]
MDDILTEDDFDDFAAAVGEGGDGGSEDDARSDDFLSWLLVHADSIDPKLEDCVIGSDGSEVAAPARAAAVGGAAADLVADSGAAAADCGMFAAAAAPEVTPPTTGTVAAAAAVATRPPGGSGNTRDTTASGADRVGKEGGAGDPSGGGAAFRVGAVGIGSAPEEGVLQSSSLATVGRIPSDPVLAMQMGARMALSGNLGLIPFGASMGTGGIAGAIGGTPAAGAKPTAASTQAQHPLIAPPAALPPAAGAMAAATAAGPPASVPPLGGLPAWTGLPHPPQWLKTEEHPQGVPPSHKTNSSSRGLETPGVTGAGSPKGTGSARQAAGVDTGAYSGGEGKKRPRADGAAQAAKIEETRARARDTSKDGRKRKKMSLGELEERVKQVSEDNGQLKLHLSNVNDKLMLMASKKKLMEAEIAAKLEAQRSHPSDSNQASLAEALSRFKDLYADYGKQRKQEVEFHLRQLERQIVPTDTTKMSLWTLEQDESFYKDRKRGSLSLILRAELGVSEEQIERIQERRARIKSLLNELGESLRLVRDLQKSSEAKTAKFEEVMERLQSAFSPQQIARLLLWVSANRAHISKLPLLPKTLLQQR